MNVEKLLAERIGEAAGKLHTARSRNDQVAVDIRMYLKEEIDAISDAACDLQRVLLDLADHAWRRIENGVAFKDGTPAASVYDFKGRRK